MKLKAINYKQASLGFLFFGVFLVLIFLVSRSDYFVAKQRAFNHFLMTTIRELQNGIDGSTLLYLIGVSVLYGFFHAMGPGHGKLVMSNFLLDARNGYQKAIRTSFFTTITHVGMALILAYVLKYLLHGAGHFARRNTVTLFQNVSGIAIMAIGLFIFMSNFFPKKEKLVLSNSGLTGFVAGIVPCPLSMTIILLSISYSIEYIGFILIGAVAFGIFSFLILFSSAFIFFKSSALKWSERGEKRILKYVQSICYVLIGLIVMGAFV